MYKKIFNGPTITLIDILDAREVRSDNQKDIFNQYTSGSLLSITMNIPGNIKTSSVLQSVFDQFIAETKKKFKNIEIKYFKSSHLSTGSEGYLFINIDPLRLKKMMVEIEENHPLGRVFDLDVLVFESGIIRDIKRQEVGVTSRKCYICNRPAKECARSKKHTIEEMQEYIAGLVQAYKKICFQK